MVRVVQAALVAVSDKLPRCFQCPFLLLRPHRPQILGRSYCARANCWASASVSKMWGATWRSVSAWTPRGAHVVLQLRAAALTNNRWNAFWRKISLYGVKIEADYAA